VRELMPSNRTHSRRTMLGILATAIAPIRQSLAQGQQQQTIRLNVPFTAGTGPDLLARILAEELRQRWNQPVIVENKPGASGNIGTDAVAKAAPDGTTIGVSIGGPLAINTLLFSKLPYDPKTDIAPITQLVTQPSALAVNSQVMVNSAAELVALLKREPGKYNFGSIGNGSLSHLAMEAIALASGTQMVHIPYPSSPAAMTAIIRGDVQMGCLPAIAVTPHTGPGGIKILAVSTAKRSPYLPDIPTLKEGGIDVDADAWMGMIGPAHTPEGIVAKIQREVVEAIGTAAIRDKLAAQLMEPVGNSPAEFRARIDGEIARWAPVIKAANIKVN